MSLMLSQDEIRERAAERRIGLIVDAQAFTRALHYLQHTRASKTRAGAPLTWRDAEAALHGRAGTLVWQYKRAVGRLEVSAGAYPASPRNSSAPRRAPPPAPVEVT